VIESGLPPRCFIAFCRPSGRTLPHELSLCLCDGVPSVVIRIAFFVCAIVGDALHDDFRIIPARQGSFRISPICFRLAMMAGGHAARAAQRFHEISRRFRRIFVEVKVLLMVNGIGFLVRSDEECLVVFSIRESRQTKKPRNIRGCRIAAILRSQSTQERFRLTGVEAFDSPDDLVLSGRSVENEVWCRNITGSTDRLKRSAGLLIKVQIRIANLADLFFGPVSRPCSYWIHSDENVGSRLVLVVKPGLEGRACDCFGRKNSLGRLVPSSIPDKHRDLIAWLVKSEHVFRRRQKSWRERRNTAQACSLGAT
jgi:hypothetical protein